MPAEKPQPTIEELQAQLARAQQEADAARAELAKSNGSAMLSSALMEALGGVQAQREARLKLAFEGEENDAETEAEMVSEIRGTDALLREQKKFTITLHLNPEDEGKGLFEIVQINGGMIYQILRGEPVDVPESIYQALVASHLRVRPQRDEDKGLVLIPIRPGYFGQPLALGNGTGS